MTSGFVSSSLTVVVDVTSADMGGGDVVWCFADRCRVFLSRRPPGWVISVELHTLVCQLIDFLFIPVND